MTITMSQAERGDLRRDMEALKDGEASGWINRDILLILLNTVDAWQKAAEDMLDERDGALRLLGWRVVTDEERAADSSLPALAIACLKCDAIPFVIDGADVHGLRCGEEPTDRGPALRFVALDVFEIKGRGRIYTVHVDDVYPTGANLREAWIGQRVRIAWDKLTLEGVISGVELFARGGSFGPRDTAGILLKAERGTDGA